MKRKLLAIISILALFLFGCNKDQSQDEKFYDEQFIESLARGLDKRWEKAEENKLDEEDSLEALLNMTSQDYKNYINIELDEINDYTDKKFESSELKELAISYINELNNGLEVADKFGSDSFFDEWPKHYNNRTKILNDINNYQDIPVENKDILNQLLAQGKDVEQKNKKQEEISQILNNITFEQESENEYDNWKEYSAIVENTTDYNFENLALLIKLYDEDDVNVATEHAHIDHWLSGEKTRIQFGTDQNFVKTVIEIDWFDE